MTLITRLLAIAILFFAPAAFSQIDEAYNRARVTFERVNASEPFTNVYDANGNVMGRFFKTHLEVPVDDRTIFSSIAPNGQRIMTEVLPRGMMVKNTRGGPMVRVLVNRLDGYQADRTGVNRFNTLNTPTGQMYVPLAEFKKMRAVGLTGGNKGKGNPNYVRFLSALRQPSGMFVALGNDPHETSFHQSAPEVNPKHFAMYPPTCDCARGKCSVTSTFGGRSAPVPGASTNHRAIDINGGQGTKLVAPDRVEIVSAGWVNGYGWRTVMKSLNYTNPQMYYAFNHQVERPPVSPGRVFEPGEEVGLMGATGYASGPHLHLEVYRGTLDKDSRIDPLPFVRMNMQRLTTKNGEIISYSCANLRARIRGGPSLPGTSGGSRSRARQ